MFGLNQGVIELAGTSPSNSCPIVEDVLAIVNSNPTVKNVLPPDIVESTSGLMEIVTLGGRENVPQTAENSPDVGASAEGVLVVPPSGRRPRRDGSPGRGSGRRPRRDGSRGRGSGRSSSARSSSRSFSSRSCSSHPSQEQNSRWPVVLRYGDTHVLTYLAYAYPTLGDAARAFRTLFPELVTRDFYIQIPFERGVGGMAYIVNNETLRLYLDTFPTPGEGNRDYPVLIVSLDMPPRPCMGLCRADYC
ncbi:hypothetical protein OROMI_001540 [Orobanche minor]